MIGAEVAARYTAKVGDVLSPLPLNQTLCEFNMGRGYTQYSFPVSGSNDILILSSAFFDYVLSDGTLLHVQQAQS